MTSRALDPLPPVTNCHTFSDPLPLERDVLYGRPLNKSHPLLDSHFIQFQRLKSIYHLTISTEEEAAMDSHHGTLTIGCSPWNDHHGTITL